MKFEQAECSETSAYKIQIPGNHSKERIQQSKSCETRGCHRTPICITSGSIFDFSNVGCLADISYLFQILIRLDVRSFRGADCGTDHYLVIAKVRERLAVDKQAAQRFDRQRFNLRKLNEPEVRELYQVEITNRFAALENSDDDEDINRNWENIKENIQTSAKERVGLNEFKQNKP